MKKLNDSNDYEFGIYEVFYDEQGSIKGYTEDSLTPTCQSEEDLLYELELMKEAFKKETLIYG